MRHCSHLLFAIALALFLLGLLQAISRFHGLGPDNGLRFDWLIVANSLYLALLYSTLPFVRAVTTHRFDHWMRVQGKLEQPD
jgi:hypothetical protein